MSCEACRASVRPESVPVLARVVIVPRPVVACTALAIPVTVCVVPPPPIGRGGGGGGRAPGGAAPRIGPPTPASATTGPPASVPRKEKSVYLLSPLSANQGGSLARG